MADKVLHDLRRQVMSPDHSTTEKLELGKAGRRSQGSPNILSQRSEKREIPSRFDTFPPVLAALEEHAREPLSHDMDFKVEQLLPKSSRRRCSLEFLSPTIAAASLRPASCDGVAHAQLLGHSRECFHRCSDARSFDETPSSLAGSVTSYRTTADCEHSADRDPHS